MKNKLKVLAIGGISTLVVVASFAFTQDKEPKKTRHIKMVKIENGKKMEIDTVLTGDDVFVWNGDTLAPEKHIKKFSPSEFDKMHRPGADRREKNVRIYKHRGGGMGNTLMMDSDSTKEIQIYIDDNDTSKEKIFIHKMLRDGDPRDHVIFREGPVHGQFPPVPGAPGVPHIMRFQKMHSNNSINLNDPNVISFKKKDIGGGKEKIEIIRKKSTAPEHQEFNYNFNENFQMPEPPMPPSLDEEQVDHENMIREQIEIEKSNADKKAERKAAKENK